MDKRVRRNELCNIGLPRCDYVFSSTRTCFIGYPFKGNQLELDIICSILTQRGIEPIKAGDAISPGQNAFCVKICSKIIMSQFCIILLNNDERHGNEIPNANVNMEYGLMLGFNKHVIPFQRESQKLPFNVAGLDTIKYTDQNFKNKAEQSIEDAISVTTQEEVLTIELDQEIETLLLSKRLLVVSLVDDGHRNLFELGRPLGFNLLCSFDGIRYAYFGNFTALRPENMIWRLRILEEIIAGRMASIQQLSQLGITEVDEKQKAALSLIFNNLTILLIVTSDEDKNTVKNAIDTKGIFWPVEILTLSDIKHKLSKIGRP